jgi:hypothetical protein
VGTDAHNNPARECASRVERNEGRKGRGEERGQDIADRDTPFYFRRVSSAPPTRGGGAQTRRILPIHPTPPRRTVPISAAHRPAKEGANNAGPVKPVPSIKPRTHRRRKVAFRAVIFPFRARPSARALMHWLRPRLRAPGIFLFRSRAFSIPRGQCAASCRLAGGSPRGDGDRRWGRGGSEVRANGSVKLIYWEVLWVRSRK